MAAAAGIDLNDRYIMAGNAVGVLRGEKITFNNCQPQLFVKSRDRFFQERRLARSRRSQKIQDKDSLLCQLLAQGGGYGVVLSQNVLHDLYFHVNPSPNTPPAVRGRKGGNARPRSPGR